jgi:hypothetical protein
MATQFFDYSITPQRRRAGSSGGAERQFRNNGA